MKRRRNDAAAQFLDVEARAADSDEEDEEDEEDDLIHGASIDSHTHSSSIEIRWILG